MTTEDGRMEHSSVRSPRSVLRGVKGQLAAIGLDTLYLVVEYPHDDLFRRWSAEVDDVDESRLFSGHLVDDLLIKRGVHGYKLSVWDGDARIFVTERVNDNLENTSEAGHGMGAMLQLGPKWLKVFGDEFDFDQLRANIFAQLEIFGMHNPSQYKVRVNRLDVAVDVLGLDITTLSLDDWQKGWVGYAKLTSVFFENRTGQVSGFKVGTRKGNVSLTIYDKRLESAKDGDAGFWLSVWEIEAEDETPVTRFEWSVMCYRARFPGFKNLDELSFEGLMGVLNYASLKWGRLCVPTDNASRRSRWPLTPLWQELRGFIIEWGDNDTRYRRPRYDLRPDLKDSYIQSAVGWIAGPQARLGTYNLGDVPASLADVLFFLAEEGYTLDEIERKAGLKLRKINSQSGRDFEGGEVA